MSYSTFTDLFLAPCTIKRGCYIHIYPTVCIYDYVLSSTIVSMLDGVPLSCAIQD